MSSVQHRTTPSGEDRVVCMCDEGEDCWFFDPGYPWCRPCGEHHRPPECAVDQAGYALASCGCRWDDINDRPDNHRPACCYSEYP